jgi:hypothetical protein
MERIRADLLRRARNEQQREGDLEQNSQGTMPMPSTVHLRREEPPAAQTPAPRNIFARFPVLPQSFTQRHASGEVPKSPEQPPTRPLTLASSRYSEHGNPPSSLPSPVPMAHLQPQRPSPPAAAAMPITTTQQQHSGEDLGYGSNPPLQPATPALTPERRQPSETDNNEENASSTKPHPKHFMFCFPWVKSRRVRSQILTCFVSGMFLATLLAVCKFQSPTIFLLPMTRKLTAMGSSSC